MNLARRLGSEATGTAFLLAAVVGPGIMAGRLAGGNGAVALLANALATGAALVALIVTFGPRGCVRFRPPAVPFAVASYIVAACWFTASTSFANPAVTLARSLSDTFSGIRPVDVPLFVLAQFAGALAATLMFRWFFQGLSDEAKTVSLPHDDD